MLLPLIQGTLWTLALSGWRYWNKGAAFSGQSLGSKVRRWWWGVNNVTPRNTFCSFVLRLCWGKLNNSRMLTARSTSGLSQETNGLEVKQPDRLRRPLPGPKMHADSDILQSFNV